MSLKPWFHTPDLSGRIANVTNARWRDVPLISGQDGAITGVTFTTSETTTGVAAGQTVVIVGVGYTTIATVTTVEEATTITVSDTGFDGTGLKFCIGGLEAFARDAFTRLKAHIQIGSSDTDVTVKGMADITGDNTTDWCADVDDAETIFDECHRLLTLVNYCTSQYTPGGDRWKQLAQDYMKQYQMHLRNAVQLYAAKLLAAGTISSMTDHRSAIAARMVRV